MTDDLIDVLSVEQIAHKYAEQYEFDDGEGGLHVPTESERIMLLDFAAGLVTELIKCPGVQHASCNYLPACGTICNKCGQLVQPTRERAVAALPAQAGIAAELTAARNAALSEGIRADRAERALEEATALLEEVNAWFSLPST